MYDQEYYLRTLEKVKDLGGRLKPQTEEDRKEITEDMQNLSRKVQEAVGAFFDNFTKEVIESHSRLNERLIRRTAELQEILENKVEFQLSEGPKPKEFDIEKLYDEMCEVKHSRLESYLQKTVEEWLYSNENDPALVPFNDILEATKGSVDRLYYTYQLNREKLGLKYVVEGVAGEEGYVADVISYIKCTMESIEQFADPRGGVHRDTVAEIPLESKRAYQTSKPLASIRVSPKKKALPMQTTSPSKRSTAFESSPKSKASTKRREAEIPEDIKRTRPVEDRPVTSEFKSKIQREHHSTVISDHYAKSVTLKNFQGFEDDNQRFHGHNLNELFIEVLEYFSANTGRT